MKKTLSLVLACLLPGVCFATTTERAHSSNGGTTGNISVAAPTGTTTGDLVILIINGNNHPACPTDNNTGTAFTQDLCFDNGNYTVSIWSRRIQAGDPSTYNFNHTSNRWGVIAVTFQNPDPTTIYDVIPASARCNVASSANAACPTMTTINNNAIHICAATVDGASASITGFPSGYTQTAVGGNANQPATIVYKVITPAGATGAQSFTNTNTSNSGCSYSILDSGGAPPAAASANPILMMGI